MSKRRSGDALEAVFVQGLERRWKFPSGITAAEVIDVVAAKLGLPKPSLFVQAEADTDADADPEPIVLANTSKLLPNSKFSIFLKAATQPNPATQPNRRFGAGVAVNPRHHYYVPPKVDALVEDLKAGKYCVLLGPRQSGKSTSVFAAKERILAETDTCVVYLDSVGSADSTWDGPMLWRYLWNSLHYKCPILFPTRAPAPDQECSELHFRSLFLKPSLVCPVTVILDEADSLRVLSPSCLHEFFHCIRTLKNDEESYNLHGFLLVGVETVRDLLEAQYQRRALGGGRVYMPGSTPSPLSPFPHDHVLPSTKFQLDDIEELLGQAATDRHDVKIDVKEIAASIMQWTEGHKGLTGTCLAYLVQERLWSFKQWLDRAESYLLGTYIFGQATYNSMLSYVRWQARDLEVFNLLLKLLSVEKEVCDAEMVLKVRDFIAHGVVVVDCNEEGIYAMRISSPLLRTAVLRGFLITSDSVDQPPCADCVDRRWLILQSIKTLDGDAMCRPVCSKVDGSPAEYAHQFLFMCRVKAVLKHAYSSIKATVLPEVKEVAQSGVKRSQLRLDILVRDSDNFSKFGFELVADGDLDNVLAHLKKAKAYQEQHSAQVFVINFIMNKNKEQEVLVAPDHDSLIFMSVNFKPITRSATVTFVEPSGCKEVVDVSLKIWDGCFSFAHLY